MEEATGKRGVVPRWKLVPGVRDPAHERVTPGGLPVITSPYTWLGEFTERSEWIGGFRKDGEPYTTLEALQDLLGPQSQCLGEPLDIPFVNRETRRKHQHIVAEMTVWERL